MNILIPGTTPTHTFTVPYAASDLASAYVTYKQKDNTILTKTTNTFTTAGEGCSFDISLTQEETMAFTDGTIFAQVNLITEDDERFASKPIPIDCIQQLYRTVIS